MGSFLFVSILFSCARFLASEFQPDFCSRHYVCYRTGEPIKVDGKIEEAAWDKAEWTEDFVDIEGRKKPAPKFRTRAKMLWDEDYFYFAADLEDPHVWATLTERDSIIFNDNDFEIFIDPDGDTFHYCELEINALNTVWDLFLDKPYRDGGKPLSFWNIQGLKTAVSVNGTINRSEHKDTGWTAEIAIPWAVLKECAGDGKAPSPGDQWRVNFSRVQWQVEVKDKEYSKVLNPETGKSFPEDNWVWSPQGLINMHYPELWGFVQFSGKIAGKGTDSFHPRPEEGAKWALRQLYYRQKDHFEKKGEFTDSLSELNLEGLSVKGYKWPPEIRHTWTLYEACLESLDGREKLHISQDGRVWRSMDQ